MLLCTGVPVFRQPFDCRDFFQSFERGKIGDAGTELRASMCTVHRAPRRCRSQDLVLSGDLVTTPQQGRIRLCVDRNLPVRLIRTIIKSLSLG